jgi:hypothetical protein
MTMKKMRILVGLAIAGAVMSAWLPARGQTIGDFRVGSSINSGGVVDFAVTPNDRFVVVLNSTQLEYLDTWNFRMVPDRLGIAATTSVIGGTTATGKALTLSPDGKFAFVACSDGAIVTVNLVPLNGLLPWQALETDLLVGETVVVPTAATVREIDHLVVIPNLTAGQPDHLLFTAGVITYHCAVQNGVLASPVKMYEDGLTGKSVTELVRGKNYAYELFRLNSYAQMRIHSCNSNSGVDLGCSYLKAYTNMDGATVLSGLAANPKADTFALVSYPSLNEIWSIDISKTSFAKVSQSGPAAVKLALLSGPLSLPDLLFSAQTGSAIVGITPLSSSGLGFGGATYSKLATPEKFTKLTAGSGADGYVYGSGGSSVRLVTANPIIDPVVVTPGATVTSGFTLDIVIHSAQQLAVGGAGIFTDQVFGYVNWKTQLPGLISGSIPVLNGDTTEIVLHYGASAVDKLPHECGNALTVVAVDAVGHQGRMAFTVNVDRAPPPQPFNLDFGDGGLMYSLSVINNCDLARIEVWYGTDPAVTDYASLLASGNIIAATYGSLTTGARISGNIRGLTNGKLYYVWTVMFDQAGNKTLSAAQSAMPQNLLTLTDLTHERGQGGCFGAVTGRRRGDPAELALLLAPLLIGGGLSVGRRVMMRRVKR